MRLSCGYETKKARVEMIPIIDVVFLLLVFFIYAMLSMVVHRGLKVDLPAAGSAALDKNQSISISIDNGNRLFVDRQPVASVDDAVERVQQLLRDRKLPVFIDGDRQAGLGLAIELLDRLRRAGIEEVSFSCIKPVP